MADIYKIKESWMGVWVRKGPGVNYGKISVIYGKDNKEYTVYERKNKYWLRIGDNRWVCDRDSNGMITLVQTGSTSTAKVTVTPDPPVTYEAVDEESYAYVPDSDVFVYHGSRSVETEYYADLENNFTIDNLSGIFGMPYQFMESADPRVNNKSNGIGRKYAKEVVASMPLLLITPGVPRFMGEFNKDDKKNVMQKFLGYATGLESEIKGAILENNKFGKYYSLEYAFNDYYGYVNPMCRVAARIMNLQSKTINGKRLDEMEWSKSTNSKWNKLFNPYNGYTAWYCDSEKEISDSFSNDTTQSMLADKINSLSDYGREFQFLLGSANATFGTNVFSSLNGADLETNMENINDFIDKSLGTSSVSGIFKTLTNSVQTVIAGGKLVFPELWASSSFSRSYDIKLKLVSPDGDDLSIYLNIIVPILHLLGLVLPRESGESHGYISPFLVRAFYKGLFNVDMGIITDLSITKGKESAWNANGLPLTVDVSLTIKDLYNDIYLTNMSKMHYNMMNNIILMDYISNLCGVNINEPDIFRGIDLFLIQNVKNRITDTWHMKIWGNLNNWVTNKYQEIFGKF